MEDIKKLIEARVKHYQEEASYHQEIRSSLGSAINIAHAEGMKEALKIMLDYDNAWQYHNLNGGTND